MPNGSTIAGKTRDVTTDGLYIQVSDYNRSTESAGLQHVNALSFVPPELSPFQQRLIALERELAYPQIERGRLIRRGLAGATLWKALANRLKGEGLGAAHWRDIEGMITECERILQLRIEAGLD